MARWGGIERVWTDKFNWLADKGYDIKLLTTKQGDHPFPYQINPKVQIKDLQIRFHLSYRYKGLKKVWDQWCRQKKFESVLKIELEDYQPDIIICVANVYVPTIVKLKGHVPLIAESHDICNSMYVNSHKSIIKRMQTIHLFRSLYKADCIVTLTMKDAKEWTKYNNNVKTIANLVHLNPYNRISDSANKHVIFVGRISEQKGLPALFEIWNEVTKRHPDWTLDIYGDSDSEELTEWANNEIGKFRNIILHNPTDRIFDKYCESSIFVLTSTYEPFGLVIPEAMSCGLPVVSFDSPYGPAEIISDGIDGYIIPLGDTNTFVDKVCKLIENPELRKQMGAAGVISSQRYAAENIMPQWELLFEEITYKQINKLN